MNDIKYKKLVEKLKMTQNLLDKLPESEKAALTRPESVKQRTI